jgi:phosphoribosylformylglycinamidine synthase
MRLKAAWERKLNDEAPPEPPKDYAGMLLAVLGRWNVCSKEYVVRQYDHEVQAGSVVKPLTGARNDGPSDAAVMRPDLSSLEGIVVSHGICPKFSRYDAYDMAACAIDEAIRNNIVTGGSLDRMAVLDNFCWCDPVASERNPDGEYKLAQLVRANKALHDYTVLFGTPCISGKDSMKNDYSIGKTKISVPPTLLYSVIGKIKDVRKAVTMDAKRPQDIVYIIGETFDELGGSEWLAEHGAIGNKVPQVDVKKAIKKYRALHKAIQTGLVASCHDCSDGGLGVALIETAFAGGLGMNIDLKDIPYLGKKRNDYILFSETASRFVVTIHPQDQSRFEKIMAGNVVREIGFVTNDGLFQITGLNGKLIIKEKISKLKEAWQKPLNFYTGFYL